VAISCGIDNKFVHTSLEVLVRYEERGAEIALTDWLGCVTYRIRVNRVEASGFVKKKAANPPRVDRL
jgi:beta-lactamase superfamily II metal-dependent hydrolase